MLIIVSKRPESRKKAARGGEPATPGARSVVVASVLALDGVVARRAVRRDLAEALETDVGFPYKPTDYNLTQGRDQEREAERVGDETGGQQQHTGDQKGQPK